MRHDLFISFYLIFTCYRVWDVNNKTEIQSLKFTNAPNSIELSSDGEMFVLTQGKCVEFYSTRELVLYIFIFFFLIN